MPVFAGRGPNDKGLYSICFLKPPTPCFHKKRLRVPGKSQSPAMLSDRKIFRLKRNKQVEARKNPKAGVFVKTKLFRLLCFYKKNKATVYRLSFLSPQKQAFVGSPKYANDCLGFFLAALCRFLHRADIHKYCLQKNI